MKQLYFRSILHKNIVSFINLDVFTSFDFLIEFINFSDGAVAVKLATFGQGIGNILLDQVNCVGTETNLAQCVSNPPGLHDCAHSEDAGVRCRGAQGGGNLCLCMYGNHPNRLPCPNRSHPAPSLIGKTINRRNP